MKIANGPRDNNYKHTADVMPLQFSLSGKRDHLTYEMGTAAASGIAQKGLSPLLIEPPVIVLIKQRPSNQDRRGIRNAKSTRKIIKYRNWLNIVRICGLEKALGQRLNQLKQAMHHIIVHSSN
jgi:hypothetical protein